MTPRDTGIIYLIKTRKSTHEKHGASRGEDGPGSTDA